MTIAEQYRRGRHLISTLHTHLVFPAKNRRGMPGADMPQRCQDTMRTARPDFGAEPPESSDQDDHLHLLADDPPKAAISALVNSPKDVPARRLRSEFTSQVNQHIMHGHFWSPYLAASCGSPPLSIIRRWRPARSASTSGRPRPTGRPPVSSRRSSVP